jgi:secreted trypsin-like serine protease
MRIHHVLGIVLLAVTFAAGLAQETSNHSTKPADTRAIRDELKLLEQRSAHHSKLPSQNPHDEVEAARRFARTVANRGDAAYVRAFHAALTGVRSSPLLVSPTTQRPVLATLMHPLDQTSLLHGMTRETATPTLYDDAVFLANAKRLIEGPHAILYPAGQPDRITGGFADTANSYPDCVAVGSTEDGYCCTGTLIGPNVVLTAGHCFNCCDESHGGQIFVGQKVSQKGITVKVKHAVQHPRYGSAGKHNDLTLLILAEDVSAVTPCRLASTALIDHAAEVTLAGYGNTNFGGTVGYGTRRVAVVPTAMNSTVDYGCDPGLEFAAGGIGLDLDSCRGDSGGPAFVAESDGRWYLAGVTSRMTKQAQRTCGDGGIYVRVDKYADWINAAAKENGGRLSSAGALPRSAPPIREGKTPEASPKTDVAKLRDRSTNTRHVVYIHGICAHSAGYSDSWWAAMRPYVSQTVPDENRHEVLWSDLIYSGQRAHRARRGGSRRARSHPRPVEGPRGPPTRGHGGG